MNEHQPILIAAGLTLSVCIIFYFIPFTDTVNLDEFFKASQFPLLALVVALGAYVSSVRQKIYETSASPEPIYDPVDVAGVSKIVDGVSVTTKAKKRKTTIYDRDLYRLGVVDFFLILNGILLVVRIVWTVHSTAGQLPPPILGRGIIALLTVTVLYFSILHVFQWVRK